jgi:hypothetical protein
MDPNGINDILNMVFTSCNGTYVHVMNKWPRYSIRCDENNGRRHTLRCWYTQHVLY